MKILLSVCYLLTITSHGLGINVETTSPISDIIKVYVDECTDGQHHYHYYPYDCQKYFSCENGTLEIETCSSDLYWNEIIKSCDIKENVDCSNIIPFPDPDCSKSEDAYYLYPYDCQKFYECFKGERYILTCPPDSLWNDALKKCDESGDVDCSDIIPSPDTTISTSTITTTPKTTTHSTTTRSTTTAPTTSAKTRTTATREPFTTLKPECTYEHQYFPYPYDCSKYYECSNYKAVLMECPPGELWDNKIQTCNWAQEVDCVASTTPSPVTNASYF